MILYQLERLTCIFRVTQPIISALFQVLFSDAAKIAELSDAKDFLLPHRMRSSFFLSHILCRNVKAQTNGVVILLMMRERDVNRFSPLPFEIFVKACPLKIKSVYSVQAIDDDSKYDFIHSVMPSAVQVTSTFFGKASIPIFGESKEEILAQLQKYGMRKEACPPSCGGLWDSHGFLQTHGLIATPEDIRKRSSSMSSSSENDRDRARQNTAALMKLGEAMSGRISRNNGVSVNEAVEKEALLQLEDALSVIPDIDKVDYYNAKALSPALVAAESNPILFLRTEKYNPWAAARRLVAYWKERKSIFGDKAFVPLTYDTLPKNAQKLIDVRCFESLPVDDEGRSVVCINSAVGYGEGWANVAEEDRLAAFFYVIRIALENPKSQTDSLVTIHPMVGSEHLSGSMSRGLHMLVHVFPLRWNKAHFVCIKPAETEDSNNFFVSIFQILIKFITQVNGPQLMIHVTNSPQEMLSRLRMYGFWKEKLPDSIGGSLDDEYFRKFKDERRIIDSEFVSELQAENNRQEDRKRDSPSGNGEGSNKRPRRDNAPSNAVLYEYEESGAWVETPSIIKRGLEEMEAAIDLLPDDDKAVLLQARLEIPELVEKETPLIRFLRVERYNAWAAAKRLALYWKERKNVFGESAFLPLNQTGEGALSRDDVAFINSGFFALLGLDLQGRSVIYHDSSRRTSHLRDPRLRALFYFWTMLSENENSQLDGYQLITAMGKPVLDTVVSDAERLIAEAMPTRTYAMHICNVPTVSEKKSFMETMLPVLFRLIGGLKKRSHVHVGETKEDIVKKLLMYDIPSNIVPKCLGGTWGFEEFSKWQEARLRYEWDLPPASKDHDNPNIPNYHAKALSEMVDEEKTERKRRMNVLHARRRREREKIEMEVFAEQVAELQDENARLRSQNTRLDGLLSSAKLEVAKIEAKVETPLDAISEGGAARMNASPQGNDYDGSSNWGLQLLLNKNSRSNGQHINLQNFLLAPSNSNFENATGLVEPNSFSLSLENRQQLASTLALQQAQERHLLALGQQQLGLRHPPPAYSSSGAYPANTLDYQHHQQRQQQQQQAQQQQQNFISNLVNGSWYNGQGPQQQQPR
ncbi:hypothetical protein MPSEU_000035400 [Mayamaea pseudoterrestris]|nr:hypothetical protein MPSEU_000035400 [Mayamaea pseudoterrestris]